MLTNNYKETAHGFLPQEWNIVTIGSLGEVITGRTPSTKEQKYYGGPYKLISPVNLGHKMYIDTAHKWLTEEGLAVSKVLPKDTVLVSCIGYYIGKTGLTLDEKSATNQQINAIICNSNADPHFIYFLLTHLQRYLETFARVTTLPILNKTNFAAIEIPLPPLPEQRAIAHVLSTVRQVIEATEQVIAATRELKRSMMKHLFNYGPVPIDQTDQVALKKTEIGDVPDGWDVVKLQEVIEHTQYGLNERASLDGMYPILRMNNLIEGKVNTTNLKYVDLDEETYQRFLVHNGDVLFNRTNSFELVGKTSIFDIGGDYVFASYLIRVLTRQDTLKPSYLNYYINWEKAKERLKMLATRGVSQSNISATKLRSYVIPLPPLNEQHYMTQILEQVENKRYAEAQRKSALEALFNSLLHHLMTGKVRVPLSALNDDVQIIDS